MKPSATLAEWLAYQQSVHPRAIDLGLSRLAIVARRLGLERPAFRVFTVAGTNGKGSVAHTFAALLTASGVRTGLFTSPHLLRYNERIGVDGLEASDAELCAAFERIEAAREQVTLTYYEFNALAAWLHFTARQVQCVVQEVGLGGRLDATNLLAAEIAVITSIGLDHVELLGPTRMHIGCEKAGIVRTGQTVILGTADMPQSVWDAAAAQRASLRVAGVEFQWSGAAEGRWNYRDDAGQIEHLPAPQLPGAIQYRNAAAALAAARAARPEFSWSAERVGGALAAVRLPGRLQRVQRRCEWWFDVAHNPPAAQVLAAELHSARARLGAKARVVAIFGMLADKDVTGVARVLEPLIDHWIFLGTPGERGLDAATLAARARLRCVAQESASDIVAACARAEQLTHAGDLIVVSGSFHTVGPALSALKIY